MGLSFYVCSLAILRAPALWGHWENLHSFHDGNCARSQGCKDDWTGDCREKGMVVAMNTLKLQVEVKGLFALNWKQTGVIYFFKSYLDHLFHQVNMKGKTR